MDGQADVATGTRRSPSWATGCVRGWSRSGPALPSCSSSARGQGDPLLSLLSGFAAIPSARPTVGCVRGADCGWSQPANQQTLSGRGLSQTRSCPALQCPSAGGHGGLCTLRSSAVFGSFPSATRPSQHRQNEDKSKGRVTGAAALKPHPHPHGHRPSPARGRQGDGHSQCLVVRRHLQLVAVLPRPPGTLAGHRHGQRGIGTLALQWGRSEVPGSAAGTGHPSPSEGWRLTLEVVGRGRRRPMAVSRPG